MQKDVESDTEENNLCESFALVSLTKEEKVCIRSQWSHALILKTFGCTVGYQFLAQHVKELWTPSVTIDATTTPSHSTTSPPAELDTFGPWLLVFRRKRNVRKSPQPANPFHQPTASTTYTASKHGKPLPWVTSDEVIYMDADSSVGKGKRKLVASSDHHQSSGPTKPKAHNTPKPISQNIKSLNEKGSQINEHLSKSTKSIASFKALDKATNPSSSTTFQFSARAPSSSTDAPFSIASPKPNNVVGNLDQQSCSGAQQLHDQQHTMGSAHDL
nr:hypothetical protein CFP56_77376 [Quercus suber]